MNDGTNIASDDIILKPKFRYWLMKNFLLITLAIFVFIFTNIYIYSGDKSTPELLMNGLKANSDIIQTIRNRVEEQKKKKGIYEFTNR